MSKGIIKVNGLVWTTKFLVLFLKNMSPIIFHLFHPWTWQKFSKNLCQSDFESPQWFHWEIVDLPLGSVYGIGIDLVWLTHN